MVLRLNSNDLNEPLTFPLANRFGLQLLLDGFLCTLINRQNESHSFAVLVLIKEYYSKGNCSLLITHIPEWLVNATHQEIRATKQQHDHKNTELVIAADIINVKYKVLSFPND